MTFDMLTKTDIGKSITAIARVKDIYQTNGPTIFTLSDGASSFAAKAFVKPGVRAHPNIHKGDVVAVTLRVQEYDGKLEGSIEKIEIRDDDVFAKQAEEHRLNRLKVPHVSFLIESEWLEKLRDRFEAAAVMIKQAIYDNRQIIVRHNADCDGYSGAVALEKAILKLVGDHHDKYNLWRFFRRLPSKAPFYAVSDVFNDIVGMTNELLRGASLPPLVIILDNGSGKDDLLGIQMVKAYGCPVVIVDHHFVGDDVISAVVDVHINPYLVGHNSQICAGMLGVELARILVPTVSAVAYMPALAGVADRVQGAEFDAYVKLAATEGYDLAQLKRVSLCVDFAAYYLRSMEGRGFVSDLFFDKKKQSQFVSLWSDDIAKRYERALDVAKKYTHVEEKNGKIIGTIDLNSVSFMGEFPPFGKLTGIVSDWLNETHDKPVYMLGLAKDMVIIRVSKTETKFNLNKLISEFQYMMPFAALSGGGHERAGTMRFVSAARDDVFAAVVEAIGKVE
jgi:archaea-specific RecJ-like exonuclease